MDRNFAKCHGRAVLPNQQWEHVDGAVRVLAVAEGYAMVRKKGCMPFVLLVKELDTMYQLGNRHYVPKIEGNHE